MSFQQWDPLKLLAHHDELNFGTIATSIAKVLAFHMFRLQLGHALDIRSEFRIQVSKGGIYSLVRDG